ncbi:MAG: MBL fold metallo-hydrolase [Actinobacteria bacterium]|nr:MBL fold metallo-hydrolase [Actinomycetota bacterium]
MSLYLVEHRGVLSLIDTGTRGTGARVLKALEKLGRKPEDVRQIVLSHGHGDHAGDAKALREATGAPILIGAQDAAVVTGEAPYPYPRMGMKLLYAHLARFERFTPDTLISERTELEGGLVAIPTPGHTDGHISVWAPDLQALFTADTVWHLGPVAGSWRPFTQNPEQNLESVKRLADEPSEQLFFGHGPPVRKGGRDRLRRLTKP